MNLPNLITIGRILLVPLTVWLIISGAYGLAFLAFLAAGVSDGVDGAIARRYNRRTELGAYLDPIADKALLMSIYVALGFEGAIPTWLVILVVSRDVLIIGAVILSWLLDRPVRVRPHMLSKINTAGQIVLAVVVLGVLELEAGAETLRWYGAIAVGALTVGSGALYLAEWLRHMAVSAEEGGPK